MREGKEKNVRNVEAGARELSASESDSESGSSADLFSITLHNNKISKVEPQYLQINITNRPFKMEVDSGSSVSLISETDKEKYIPELLLEKSTITLSYYSGEKRKPMGFLRDIKINFGTITTKANLYVVGKIGKPLIGRDWLYALGLWPLKVDQEIYETEIKNQQESAEVDQRRSEAAKLIFKKYNSLFSSGLGTYKKSKFIIRMRTNTAPVYFKARSIPFALKEKVAAEIERLTEEKILSPVEVSDWGTPIVPIIKPDGTARLCGDYKITVNPNILINRYPLPRIEHLVANLQEGVYFSKIDLIEAYAQVPLSQESKNYLTVNTHKDLYQYNKLPYGIASAPGYFQREMEGIFAGMRNVTVFLDDIIIKGKTIKEIIEKNN